MKVILFENVSDMSTLREIKTPSNMNNIDNENNNSA